MHEKSMHLYASVYGTSRNINLIAEKTFYSDSLDHENSESIVIFASKFIPRLITRKPKYTRFSLFFTAPYTPTLIFSLPQLNIISLINNLNS